ncbi:hypothetical protein [Burkholderia pyrrocinia]
MLLPLPASVVRNFSLENHLMLAALKAGHGDKDAWSRCSAYRT